MQRGLDFKHRSDEEAIKEGGLVLDFDEMARRGSMSREEAFVAKWYGIYAMRQAGNFMARVVIPGGVLSSSQARSLAEVAEDYGMGRICFTTRQAAQLHWIKLGMLPDVLRDLHRGGLSTYHGCGDVTRNVAACSWAGECLHRRFDVLPHTMAIHRQMVSAREVEDLPRKFKITLSGCSAGCGQPLINCVGLTAKVRKGANGSLEHGFHVDIGGGMGWKPFQGKNLYTFVPEEFIEPLTLVLARLHRDHGDRWNRATSRLKWVVYRLGIVECRKFVEEHLEELGVPSSRLEVVPIEDVGPPVPARPLAATDPVEGHNGRLIQRIMIPKGELGFRELSRISELAEMYADRRVYSNNRQNLEFHGIAPSLADNLRAEVEGLGFRSTGFYSLDDITTCVGTTYCPLAITGTRELHDELEQLVRDPRFVPFRDKAVINITGCPNSCSPFSIADIGLRGMRLREKLGSTEGYQVRVGGRLDRFGDVVGEFKLDDCPRVVEKLLERFIELRAPDETLAATVERLGSQPFRSAIRSLGITYEQAPRPTELSVITGMSGTPLDMKTIARDIPCQAACPAWTRVPEYIDLIARGENQAAYLLNQEDNVFPGILGRVCTRPCQAACRHQRTGTEGPVAICHLKRAASDGKQAPPSPLPHWYGPSGKAVAIVGSGPAGLAAARELRRYGHEVTLFEAQGVLGGMMRQCIPAFRLPREILDEEIAAIIDDSIDVRLAERIDSEGLAKLTSQFDAALLSAGAIRPRTLKLPGLPAEAALGGVDFIKSYNRDLPMEIEPDVVVIGGGFTAIDCARAARRLLGPDRGRVTIAYRRTLGEMSASHEEIAALEQECIEVASLVAPKSALAAMGRLEAMTFVRHVPTRHASREKPPLEVVPGSEFTAPCKTVIFAIGQQRTLEILPQGVTTTEGHATTLDGLYVAGDFKTGALDVVHAVAEGKAAASEIDRHLTGRDRRRRTLEITEIERGETGRLRDHDLVQPPPMPNLPEYQRTRTAEVEIGFGRLDTQTHAFRCYLCNHKYEIDQDRCIHCDWCVKVAPRDCIKRLTRLFRDDDGAPTRFVETELPRDATYIWIDNDRCIRCGACFKICPTGAISLRRIRCLSVNE